MFNILGVNLVFVWTSDNRSLGCICSFKNGCRSSFLLGSLLNTVSAGMFFCMWKDSWATAGFRKCMFLSENFTWMLNQGCGFDVQEEMRLLLSEL